VRVAGKYGLCYNTSMAADTKITEAVHQTQPTLDLTSRGVKEPHIIRLCEILSMNSAITCLNLSYNPPLTPVSAMALASNTTLKHLVLRNCGLHNDDILTIIGANTSITTLKVAYNDLTDEGITPLATTNTTLVELDLSNNTIRIVGCKALARMQKLETLRISNDKIGSESIAALAESKSLQTLQLSYSGVYDADAMAIAANTSITSLWLNSNSISDEGCCITLCPSHYHQPNIQVLSASAQ
jgi:hypothetical protein